MRYLGLFVICLLLPWSGQGTPKSLEIKGQILRMGNGVEPKDLDPHRVIGAPEGRILVNLFEGLVSRHPKTLKPIPGVAKSWKVSDDGLTWTFVLRSDAKWSNGEPLTAQDFIYSWTRLLTAGTASELGQLGFYIKNGRAFYTGMNKDPKSLGITAPSPQKLVVKLERPAPFLIQLVDHFAM